MFKECSLQQFKTSTGAVSRAPGLSLHMHMVRELKTESPTPGIHVCNQATSPCELSLADPRSVSIDSHWFCQLSLSFLPSAEQCELKET